jgi:hypothetical protein
MAPRFVPRHWTWRAALLHSGWTQLHHFVIVHACIVLVVRFAPDWTVLWKSEKTGRETYCLRCFLDDGCDCRRQLPDVDRYIFCAINFIEFSVNDTTTTSKEFLLENSNVNLLLCRSLLLQKLVKDGANTHNKEFATSHFTQGATRIADENELWGRGLLPHASISSNFGAQRRTCSFWSSGADYI